ncbi:MAG: hypothetical protein M2R45_03305 [Verrucomicrobia subdivision 3 bacterium]|nr:hypothetical protein [Limisphaerales bacterium]MCS1415417.1 hypothetical protein [Limisphaerales bacterium]
MKKKIVLTQPRRVRYAVSALFREKAGTTSGCAAAPEPTVEAKPTGASRTLEKVSDLQQTHRGDRSTVLDSDHYYDTEQMAIDPEYPCKLRRHQTIKQFLASPHKDDSAYHTLLKELYVAATTSNTEGKREVAIVIMHHCWPVHLE